MENQIGNTNEKNEVQGELNAEAQTVVPEQNVAAEPVTQAPPQNVTYQPVTQAPVQNVAYQPVTQTPLQQPVVIAAPAAKKMSTGKIIGIVAGVIVVLAIIIAIIAGIAGGSGGSGSDSEGKTEKESVDFSEIYSDCGLSSTYATIASDGSYLSIDTNPNDIDDYAGNYDAWLAIEEVNEKLDLPESTHQLMLETSALDGRITEEYEDQGVSVTWKYHPDNGLEVTYRILN